MWKSFFIGISLGLSFIFLAFITNNGILFSYLTGGVGLIALLISGISSNSWSKKETVTDQVSPSEVSEERINSTKSKYRLFLFSTPLLISTFILYLI